MTRVPAEAYTPGAGEPVPRHKRNPRRAYDSIGREITPMTISNAMENGAFALRAECPCGHEAEIAIERFPPESFVPDAGVRLRCERCGAKGPTTEPIWPPVSDRR
jgi:hypothetical protein